MAPEAPVSPAGEASISASDLFRWRRSMLALVPLEGAAQPEGRAAFDWLLDVVGGVSWTTLQGLWLHPGERVSLARPRSLIEALWRRHLSTREPLQYVVGRCPWRQFELVVGPAVLIPRQETELLVELALELLPAAQREASLLWADLGTGSGCLAAALSQALPWSRGLASDVSPEALAVARGNLEALGAEGRVILRRAHWWAGLEPWAGRLHLVVANPPYIPSDRLAGLAPEVRDHEPRLALDGGDDGLESIRELARGAPSALAPGGVLLLEHHHDQSAAVGALLKAAGLEDVAHHRDLEGVLRFASGRRAAPIPSP